jgi:RimJ/RimL family protein N-acetyltransferase
MPDARRTHLRQESDSAEVIERIMQRHPQIAIVRAITRQRFGAAIACDGERALLRLLDFILVEGPVDEPFAAVVRGALHAGSYLTSSNARWYDAMLAGPTLIPERRLRALYTWRDRDRIRRIVDQAGIVVTAITARDKAEIRALPWAEGVFDSYRDDRHQTAAGFGYCVRHGGRIVSLCTSFCDGPDGVEIEVDTDPDHYGRGFAKSACKRFLAECANRGVTPLWDASNAASERLAISLGFEKTRDYESLYFST